MPLPVSGVITMTQIANELRIPVSGIQLGQPNLRALADRQSGPISLTHFYGKSKIISDRLQINIDFSDPLCYPGSGNAFTNLVDSSRNSGYIKNNCVYDPAYKSIKTNGANSGALYNVGDRIDINTSAGGIDRFFQTDNFSIFFWVNQAADNGGKIFSTGSAGAGTGDSDNCIWQFWMTSTSFFWWDNNGGAINNIQKDGIMHTPGIWQLIGFTYSYNENGNNVIRCYNNETFVLEASAPTATHSSRDRRDETSLQYTLGGGYTSSCYNTNSACNVGQFILYNKTLTAAEISHNFNNTRYRFNV